MYKKISYMFKKKFDNINGETRVCRVCDVEFAAKRPTFICNKCQCKKISEYRKQKFIDGRLVLKAPYPYQGVNHNYKARFDKLQSKLNKMKERHEWQAYFKERLNEVLNDELLMTWINDRRDAETKRAKQYKSKTTTSKDYPDLRGMYID